MSYSVIVCDMFHFADDENHEIIVPGFPTAETAIEYARRRLRYTLEEQRKPGHSPEELRHLWYTFGEDCRVLGPQGIIYRASSELDNFIDHPAKPEQTDYLSLYESLLPDDFNLKCEWAAGALPPPHHYEYTLILSQPKRPPKPKASAPRMQGEVIFIPDYPGAKVPIWREPFVAWTRECLQAYTVLSEGGLIDIKGQQSSCNNNGTECNDEDLGNETVTLTITARGNTISIHSSKLPPDQRQFLLSDAMPAIRSIVPADLWLKLHTKRIAYHKKC